MPRQTGYVIRIDGFLPVDKTSLASQKSAIDALSAAVEAGDPSALLKLMVGIKLRHVFASKDVETTGTATTTEKSAASPPPKKPA
jgi:hypothetical protein